MLMINKKTIIIFIVLLSVLFLYHINTTITGNLIASKINVTINPFESGRIGVFNYPEETLQYTKMNFDIEVINTGSITYNKITSIKVGGYDENLTVLFNHTGLSKSLNPGARSIETVRYTPLLYGFYWIYANVSYGNKSVGAWGSFYVNPYYTIIPVIPGDGSGGDGDGSGGDGSGTGDGGTGGTGGGVGGGSGSSGGGFGSSFPSNSKPEIDTGRILINLIHKDKIQITAGESSAVYVIVNNTGTMTLRQLKLLPKIMGNINIDAQPRMVQTLRKNNSAIFMIGIDVPKNTKNGTYPLDFNVLSDKINRTGHIDVIVGSTSLDYSLMNTILNYQYIITKIKDEKQTLDLYEKNTIQLAQYLNYSEDSLILAKKAYTNNDYGLTHNKLKITRRHIIDTIIELTRIKNQETLTVLAPTSWLLFLLITFIIITLSVVYIHKHKLNKKNDALF